MEKKKKPDANPLATYPTRRVGIKRATDTTLGWVDRQYPQLHAWRALAVEWLKGETRGVDKRLEAVARFFERYLIQQKLPLDPAVFLANNTALPDLYSTVCPDSVDGTRSNNHIHDFLNFVLKQSFSIVNSDGSLTVSPAFRNPVARLSFNRLPQRTESVHSALPYGYIEELRKMLASGANFRDWRWAQAALGAEVGHPGYCAPDWFEVPASLIDLNDPDCLWRERSTRERTWLEMWSPVRWVAMLMKLITPLRTVQVRMLDSGEADTWRYETGTWMLNQHPLAEGSERNPLQQGVFRRSKSLVESDATTAELYINTNKTADTAKSGTQKGYVLPWLAGGQVHQDIFYWLEKLRNWQEKYNPILRRTQWDELDGRHTKAKSEVQLASYPAACFLFRLPESAKKERHFPISEMGLNRCWFQLLNALELRLANRGETHPNGSPILLLPQTGTRKSSATTLFPLHSLRVSLITALALEGQVPFPVLQKLVGHARLMMTLYYTKPGATYIRDVLLGAAERLEAIKEQSIQNFLQDTEYAELLQKSICNNVPSLAAAIPQHPAARNPTGWMPMHHGLCIVGGNTSEAEENRSVGGCYNGGPINTESHATANPKHDPVPGGSRNCVRCRWFVTEPHHLPALAAHFNTLAYHLDESRNACLAREHELQDLKRQKMDAEDMGQPFARQAVYRQTERIWEKAMQRFSDLAQDLVACWRLIERCMAALKSQEGDSMQLIAAGAVCDVQAAFEETGSELLQLEGVCENVEIYPDLEPGKAILRRSQILDRVLYRENITPIFMLLSEPEQLLAGNAFMRRLSQQINHSNPMLGQREVIRLIEAGERLSRYFDLDLASLLPKEQSVQLLATQYLPRAGTEK